MRSFLESVRKVLEEQHGELADIERKKRYYNDRMSDLNAQEIEVVRGIMKAEQILEQYGVVPPYFSKGER